jgi:catechol 2,3-dioxygenase-like lactoylglutathione lyase family enzyme
MTPSKKARALGFNHIALEVGDVDEALAFYARIVDFKLRHGLGAPVKKARRRSKSSPTRAWRRT